MPKRRRRLFGEILDAMGPRARASIRPADPVKTIEQRERQEHSKRLLTGGRNKGEEKGYGATAGATEP